MKKQNENAARSRAAMLGVIALFFASVAAQAGEQVTPPPRTPGFSMVVVKGGLNPDEVKRQERAHKDKVHNKKNLVLEDDSKDKSNNANGSKK